MAHGFLETRAFGSAREILAARNGKNSLFTVPRSSRVGEAIRVMNREGIDQIPVTEQDNFVGSVSSSSLLEKIIQDPNLQDKQVGDIMEIAAIVSILSRIGMEVIQRTCHRSIHSRNIP